MEVIDIPVWSYWQGPLPPWRDLCLRTLQKHVPSINVLTPDTWQEMRRDNLGSRLDRHAPNVISDFVRAHQLYHYGGIWVDADCIAFRDLRPITDGLKHRSFVAYKVGKPSRQVCSALIASRQHGPIVSEYLSLMTHQLRFQHKLHRLALGPRLIVAAEKLACSKQSETWIDWIPTSKVHPIHWRRPQAFHKRGTDEQHSKYFVNNVDPYCCMMTSGSIGQMQSWDEHQLLESDTLLSYLLRTSLCHPSIVS